MGCQTTLLEHCYPANSNFEAAFWWYGVGVFCFDALEITQIAPAVVFGVDRRRLVQPAAAGLGGFLQCTLHVAEKRRWVPFEFIAFCPQLFFVQLAAHAPPCWFPRGL